MKKIFLLLLLFLVSLTFISCTKDKLMITGKDTVEVGCSIVLEHNYQGEEKPAWSSSDDSIASIIDGMVIGNKQGEVIITLVIGGETAYKDITVTPSLVEITIEGSNVITKGESIQFEATLSKEVSDKVVWSSSNESVATIDENGLVTAHEEGETTIKASVLGKESSYKVTVIEDNENIKIEGSNVIRVDEEVKLTCNYECYWSVSDEGIVEVMPDGTIYGMAEGTVTVYATDKNDENNVAEFIVTVTSKLPTSLIISGKNKVGVGNNIELEISTIPSNALSNIRFESSNDAIAIVNNVGLVTGVNVGTVVIKAICIDDEEVYSEISIEVVLAAPTEIRLSASEEMVQGAHNNISVEVVGEDVTKEVVWETSNPSIAICYQGIVLGVNKGKVTITASSVLDENIKGSIEIEVKGYVAEEYNDEDLARVEEILSNMNLSQKIGQMFVIGFNGTSMDSNLISAVQDYNFGNVIYMGYNVTNPNTLGELSNSIQAMMIENNGVPAFISIDQEGGRVARLVNGGTHFISNMAMGATGDYNNTYLEGVAMGKELRNYGINVDFAPVLDVNNNPENPIIGIRSYSDNPLLVSLYGKNMFTGLKESNVMGCSKHFPGHGNTSVDSHYGLPTITTPMNELYQTELAPFISSISNGIDAIMTTHIIFSAIDNEYPATLSSKVLTNLLREELGYEGLIVTDAMEMGAVTNNFGGHDVTSVLAVKAGADILTYTSNTNPKTAHTALVNAVENGEISEERINESVRRILLKKLEYGVLDNYNAKDENISELLAENEALNLKFAMDSLTLVKGEFAGLDKSKSTLIISPETTYSLGDDLLYNSFSNYAWSYLREKGYEDCDYYVVQNNISNYESEELLEMIKDFDQIVIAMSNVKTSKYSKTASFVNKVAALDKEVIVIALDTPYDLMSYSSNVKNYICVYGYQKATVVALSKYLNGEFTAKGKLAVSKENFE